MAADGCLIASQFGTTSYTPSSKSPLLAMTWHNFKTVSKYCLYKGGACKNFPQLKLLINMKYKKKKTVFIIVLMDIAQLVSTNLNYCTQKSSYLQWIHFNWIMPDPTSNKTNLNLLDMIRFCSLVDSSHLKTSFSSRAMNYTLRN